MLEIGGARTNIVAIVRDTDASADRLMRMGAELVRNGVSVVEFPLTNRAALEAIAGLNAELPGAAVGVGTVLDREDLDRAVEAGAAFAVTPTVRDEVLERSRELGMPIIVGAFTPTEIATAWRGGATAVKVFPAGPVGVDYLRALRGPLPDVPFVPTGGVAVADAHRYLRAGAIAVGLGSDLIGDGSAADIRRRVGDLRATLDDGVITT